MDPEAPVHQDFLDYQDHYNCSNLSLSSTTFLTLFQIFLKKTNTPLINDMQLTLSSGLVLDN